MAENNPNIPKGSNSRDLDRLHLEEAHDLRISLGHAKLKSERLALFGRYIALLGGCGCTALGVVDAVANSFPAPKLALLTSGAVLFYLGISGKRPGLDKDEEK